MTCPRSQSEWDVRSVVRLLYIRVGGGRKSLKEQALGSACLGLTPGSSAY